MSSPASVCNLALSHIGVGKPISSLVTDQSEEANACRVFYDISWQKALRDFAWPFARAFASPALVQTNPNTEWAYSYRVPSDCLFVRRVLSGVRNDTRQSRVPYILGRDSVGPLIFTDLASAAIEYTFNFQNEDQWPQDFIIATSYKLGQLIAPRLSKGDPFKLGMSCAQLYKLEIDAARSNALNEQQSEEDPQSEYIRARNL